MRIISCKLGKLDQFAEAREKRGKRCSKDARMLNVTASLASHFSLSHGELEEVQPSRRKLELDRDILNSFEHIGHL